MTTNKIMKSNVKFFHGRNFELTPELHIHRNSTKSQPTGRKHLPFMWPILRSFEWFHLSRSKVNSLTFLVLVEKKRNSNESSLPAVASRIHWKFEFSIFLPARRPSAISLVQFNFVDTKTQSLPTHEKKNHFASSLIAFCGPNGTFNGIDIVSLRIDCFDEGSGATKKKSHSLRHHIFVKL